MTFKLLLTTTAVIAFPALAQTTPAAQPAAAQPAAAQPGTAAAPGAAITQGAAVYDTQGGIVGTIESVNGDMVVLATTKSKVQLPKTSFAIGAKGPVIAMTASQLDQAAAQAAPVQAAATPPAKANVVQGASVVDTQGGAVGTIAEVDSQFATLTLTTGGKVRLPVTAFGAGTNGTLRIAMTAAQLSAAGAAAGGNSSSSPAGNGSSGS